MKTKLIALSLVSAMLVILAPSCEKDKDKEGCTDPNSHNYDKDADKNTVCRYRYASNIDITDVPANKGDGSAWDDGNGPDLKINFGKSASSGYAYTTNTADDAGSSATLTPSGTIKFTNEPWKFELVDADLVGSEVIATGTFNPLSSSASSDNIIEVSSNGVKFKFKFTVND